MNRFKRLTLISLLLITAISIGWFYHTAPHVYKTATSPDQFWTVTILRQRDRCDPFFANVHVTAVVSNREGKKLLEAQIDTVDLWSDVDVMYRDVICENDRIRIGPEYWDDKNFGYYEINKAELQHN